MMGMEGFVADMVLDVTVDEDEAEAAEEMEVVEEEVRRRRRRNLANNSVYWGINL
jgi:riboflavin synthase